MRGRGADTRTRRCVTPSEGESARTSPSTTSIFDAGGMNHTSVWRWCRWKAFVAPASIGAAVGLGLLEIFVAFLQAYIFVFLTALFMGMTLHPQH